ncbi:MAG: acyl-CoA dehydrogenase family protein [Odoribacteraceae bacterium]|jgi:alkylation response protein AidB-like acyl-CoA dehydrogenase|nr:acyl-CoA dehydrogenase family protein [Odoribacteraceae bacterium]
MANFYTDNTDIKFHLEHPLMKKIVALKERDFQDAATREDAPRNFEDAMDNYDKVLEIVGEICGDVLAENAEDVDAEGPRVVNGRVEYAPGTRQNHDVLTQAGLYNMSLPREYDGLNFPIVPYVMAAELVSRADAGFGNIWGLQDCAETIHEFASDDQKRRFLPRGARGETYSMDLTEPDAGSDLQAVQLKATLKDGQWLLNGVKRFITNGDAQIALVLARSEEGTQDGRGLSMFIYDRANGGMTVRRIENKLGIKGSPTCELVFKDAPAELCGDRKLGLIKYVMSLMNGARLGVGAQAVGIAEAAYREGLKYARERFQFGKAIIEFPAVYEMLANMQVKLQGARSILYETSRFVDIYKTYTHLATERSLEKEEREELKKYQKLADFYTPLLKLFASEYANEIAYDALQIHGGSGYMKDYPIQRLARDARITNIYEGTSQLQVVAAIRGVTTGHYLKQVREVYELLPVQPGLEPASEALKGMTAEYEAAVATVTAAGDPEYVDFHARRLVEMIGYIIIGYLLLQDASRRESYAKSAALFVKYGQAKVAAHAAFIRNFQTEDLEAYKKA